MANEENLKPFSSVSEAREKGRKGGLKSAETRRKRMELKEVLKVYDQLQDEETGEINQIMIAKALLNKAKAGDVKAIEVYRDTIGEKPKDVVENINPPTINIGDVKI